MKKNSNYEERDDGYHKNDQSATKGNADYFAKPLPPVRDTAGRPLVPNSGGKVDMARWIREVEHGR
jgi:hypothetical protein